MSSFVRRVFRSENSLHKKLRKAVANGKPRQVAELLEAGASPTWIQYSVHASDEMNALLLACHYDQVEILDLLLDSFFEMPQLLGVWGRHMHCIVIRNGNWKTFKRLHERHVPMDPTGSIRSKLPAPVFVAAESGQSRMLQFLVQRDAKTAAEYSFNGHSLLSIACKNGHYECVEVLLSMIHATDDMLLFAETVARQSNQPHVLVLITNCFPEYSSNNSQTFHSRSRPSVQFAHSRSSLESISEERNSGARGSVSKLRRSSLMNYNRGSIAETEILSDYENEDNRDSSTRRSSAWLYKSEQDLNVYRPYLESDDEVDPEDTQLYKDYLRGLEESLATDGEQDWTSTPPVSSGKARAMVLSSAQNEEEESTEKMLALIAEKREAHRKPKKEHKSTWYYRNEVILPYESSDDSTTGTTSSGSPQKPPRSAKPPLPPPTARRASTSFIMPPKITQVSRKLVNIRSKSMQDARASM